MENTQVLTILTAIIDLNQNQSILLKALRNKPLFAYVLETLLKLISEKQLLLFSNSRDLINLSRKYNITNSLLSDNKTNANLNEIINSAKSFCQTRFEKIDTLMIINAYYPFLSKKTIQNGLELFHKKNSQYVVSTSPVKDYPFWCKEVTSQGKLKNLPISNDRHSHQLPKLYKETDSIQILPFPPPAKKKLLKKALIIDDFFQEIKVETSFDWMLANFYLQQIRKTNEYT